MLAVGFLPCYIIPAFKNVSEASDCGSVVGERRWCIFQLSLAPCLIVVLGWAFIQKLHEDINLNGIKIRQIFRQKLGKIL